MKAMVFAAGLGTRLKPFTLDHPKALVPVGGVPMLQRVLLRLRAAGVDEAVVNVHHFADQIIDFLERNGGFGLKIHISDETDLLLDTGGGILKAAKWLDGPGPFIVHNADILTDIPLWPMVKHNMLSEAVATLLVAPRETSRYLLFDTDMSMRGWINTATGQTRPKEVNMDGCWRMAFGGVHVMSPQILPLLRQYNGESDERPFSITDFYIDTCRRHPINGWRQPDDTIWVDVGKPQSLDRAEELIAGSQSFSL